MKRAAAILATIAATLTGASAFAADASYAEGKTITFIVPYSPGGTSDVSARLLASALEKELKASVQVVNKPGAASQVGLTELLNSKPDGLTLSYGVLPTLLTHYLDPERTPPYTRESFTPIAMYLQLPNVIAVGTSSPYQTLGDLVEAARAAPGTVKVGDSGLLGAPHLMVMLLESAANVKFASVHFQGGAPAQTALLGGHIDAQANGMADVIPYIKTGEVRALGLADSKRSDVLPDLPTMAEQGYDVIGVSSNIILAPPGTSPEIVETLASAIGRISADEEHLEKLRALGVTPVYQGPEDLVKSWIAYEERVAPILAAPRD